MITGPGRRASTSEKLSAQGRQRARSAALGEAPEATRAGEREQLWADRSGATTPLPPLGLGGGTKLASVSSKPGGGTRLAAIRTDGWHCFGLPGQICRRRTGGWHQLDLGNLTGGTSLAGFGLAEQKLRVAPSWYRVDGHGIEEWHLLLTHDAVELAGDTVSGFLADPAGDEPTGGTSWSRVAPVGRWHPLLQLLAG